MCHRHETQPHFLWAYGFTLILNASSGCFDSSVPSRVSSSVASFSWCVCSCTLLWFLSVSLFQKLCSPTRTSAGLALEISLSNEQNFCQSRFTSCPGIRTLAESPVGEGGGLLFIYWLFASLWGTAPTPIPSPPPFLQRTDTVFSLNQGGVYGGSCKIFTTAGTHALL